MKLVECPLLVKLVGCPLLVKIGRVPLFVKIGRVSSLVKFKYSHTTTFPLEEVLHSIQANVLDCNTVVSKFKL